MIGIATFPLQIPRITDNDIFVCSAIIVWILGVIKGIGKIIKPHKDGDQNAMVELLTNEKIIEEFF